jgi:major membrane immunogen (membrane-anchored lipoprotein)
MIGKKAGMIVVVLILAALLVTGCGGSSGNAKEVLDKAAKNMEAWKSFKATMKASAPSNSSSPSSGYSAEYEVTTEGGMKMHGVVDYAGTKIEQYQIGDVTYSYAEGQGWQKSSGQSTEPLNKTIAKEFQTGINDLKMLSENDKAYKLSFTKTTEGTSSSGSSATSVETSFVVTVDKPTVNIREIRVKGSTGGASQEQVIVFSSVNKPITITLPEEAKNAPEAPKQ